MFQSYPPPIQLAHYFLKDITVFIGLEFGYQRINQNSRLYLILKTSGGHIIYHYLTPVQ